MAVLQSVLCSDLFWLGLIALLNDTVNAHVATISLTLHIPPSEKAVGVSLPINLCSCTYKSISHLRPICRIFKAQTGEAHGNESNNAIIKNVF